jgi:hypothetical protein
MAMAMCMVLGRAGGEVIRWLVLPMRGRRGELPNARSKWLIACSAHLLLPVLIILLRGDQRRRCDLIKVDQSAVLCAAGPVVPVVHTAGGTYRYFVDCDWSRLTAPQSAGGPLSTSPDF